MIWLANALMIVGQVGYYTGVYGVTDGRRVSFGGGDPA